MAGAPLIAMLPRDAIVAVAAALGVAALIAAVGAWADAGGHGWIAAGYWRLVRAAAWDRFIHVLPFTGPAALVVVLGARVLRSRRRRVPDLAAHGVVRAALVAIVLLGVVGAAAVIDRWRTAGGPSLVLISIDTLRADRLGAYGY